MKDVMKAKRYAYVKANPEWLVRSKKQSLADDLKRRIIDTVLECIEESLADMSLDELLHATLSSESLSGCECESRNRICQDKHSSVLGQSCRASDVCEKQSQSSPHELVRLCQCDNTRCESPRRKRSWLGSTYRRYIRSGVDLKNLSLTIDIRPTDAAAHW